MFNLSDMYKFRNRKSSGDDLSNQKQSDSASPSRKKGKRGSASAGSDVEELSGQKKKRVSSRNLNKTATNSKEVDKAENPFSTKKSQDEMETNEQNKDKQTNEKQKTGKPQKAASPLKVTDPKEAANTKRVANPKKDYTPKNLKKAGKSKDTSVPLLAGDHEKTKESELESPEVLESSVEVESNESLNSRTSSSSDNSEDSLEM